MNEIRTGAIQMKTLDTLPEELIMLLGQYAPTCI